MLRMFNNVVNLAGQSRGEGGGIGCGQRSSAGSDVINCDKFLMGCFQDCPLFFPVSNSALVSELFLQADYWGVHMF